MALGRKKGGHPLRILFVTDLHASEVVFRKMLNAVSVYEADCLVVGGDLAGKAIVPVIHGGGVWSASVIGEVVTVDDSRGLEELVARVRDLGHYPVVMDRDEYDALAADEAALRRRFLDASRAQVADWTERIAARFEPAGVPVFITGGNDDYLEIDDILDQAPYVVHADGRVVEVTPRVEMIASSYSNPTPWNCPRDIPEEQLYERIVGMAERLRSPEAAIFDLHAPPYGIGIDVAPLLDTTVTPARAVPGRTAPVGSRSVGEAIAEFQPMLGLHGHVHDSRGVKRLGRTTCVNPGSGYTEGLLHSAVVDLTAGGDLRSVQLLIA
jgi:uncharacterized protein